MGRRSNHCQDLVRRAQHFRSYFSSGLNLLADDRLSSLCIDFANSIRPWPKIVGCCITFHALTLGETVAQSLENPILNSPFRMPSRHWELSERGMPTGQALSGRRPSAYIVPIPKATRTAGQLELDVEGPVNLKTNDLVNRIRDRVDQWRALPAGQWGVTYETARLLTHWRETTRERPLFFCQVEAAETIIWLTEVAQKNRAFQELADAAATHSQAANPGLMRLAMKLATGAGKTTVMAMLIAWHTVNKARRPNSKMFTDAFLIVTPGITIKDRLRVLMPEAPDSIYERL